MLSFYCCCFSYNLERKSIIHTHIYKRINATKKVKNIYVYIYNKVHSKGFEENYKL